MAFRYLPKPVPKSNGPLAPSVTVASARIPSASGRIALRPAAMPSRVTPSLRDSVTVGLDPTRIFRDAGHTPDPWQRKVLLSSAARQLFLCSRQVGKSHTAAAIALHHAIYTLGALILLLSPSLRQSRELFRRVAGLRSQLLFQVPLTRETDLCLDFANESRVICLPGTEETIRGYSGVTLLIIDEAARVPDGLYKSVRPMLAISGGRLICMSTPWGQRGWFYNAWISEEPWERTRVTAPECPRLSQAFLDEERRTLGRQWFAQEYMAEFARASDQVFEVELVRAAFDANVLPLFNAGETI
jgi:Terminase large subunit, T4likevirus-type, N-terminal